MPSLALYLEVEDLRLLVDRIDSDDELAWIVPRRGGGWVARPSLDIKLARWVTLWHTPGGPLPLLVPVAGSRRLERRGWIADPFAGWPDEFGGAELEPRLGDPPGVFRLRLCVRGGPGERPDQPEVGLSALGWIGRHYAAIGSVPEKSTERCWNRLRTWVMATGVRISRRDPLEAERASRLDAFAFPAALAAIRAGMPRAVN